MTREDVVHLARAAGLVPIWMSEVAQRDIEKPEQFAASVAAAEREKDVAAIRLRQPV